MTEMKTGIAVKSADTSIIEQRLRTTTPGELVTYAELSTLLGRDCVECCRGNITSARRTLVKESIFFDCVSKEGYKRLTEDEAVVAAGHYRDRAKHAARRGLVHLQNVPFDNLTDEGKHNHLATSAQLGAIDLFSSSKATKKIASSVNGHKLPIEETLKLFGG
ncbi:MAG: hypothetical protein ACKO0Z_09625 [Betaproteobacteria bacterium]